MVAMHARILDLRRARVLVLPVLFLHLSCCVLGLRGEDKASAGKDQPASKEDRLKERDRYAQETRKLRKEGKTQEAIEACGKMLAIEREISGDSHKSIASLLELLGEMHEQLGDFEAARKDCEEALALLAKIYGEKHWHVSDADMALRRLKRLTELEPQERSELKEAEKWSEQVVELWKKGRSGEALPLAKKAADTSGRLLGKESREYALSLVALGTQYGATGNFRQAEEVYLQAADIWKKALGEDHPGRAAILGNLGWLYQQMGDYARAEPLLREAVEIWKKALGEETPHYATSLHNLALLYHDIGDYARAVPLFQQALEISKKTLGVEHPNHAKSLNSLALVYQAMGDYARAEPLYLQALEMRKRALGEEHPDYATSLNNLALLYQDMGDHARAEPLFRQALEIRKKALGEEHPDYATSLNNLATLYEAMSDYAQAESLLRQALEIRKKALGEEHPKYATSLGNLAALYKDKSDYARAEPLYRQALEIEKKALGEKHPQYAVSLNSLALLYKDMGDYARAEPLYRQALEIQRNALGEEHPKYATSLNNLAALYRDKGDYARAEPLYRRALEIRKNALGEKHPDYAASFSNLALLHHAMGDYARAEPLCRLALEIQRNALGEKHPDYATSLNNLAALYKDKGDYARAEPLYRQALEIKKKSLGEGHPDCAKILGNLALVYQEMKDYARAEPLDLQALEIEKKALGEEHPAYATRLNNLAELYKDMGDYARAVPLYRRALEICKEGLGEQHPAYATVLCNLGLVCLETGDYADAEPLLGQALGISRRNLDLASGVQSERQQIAMAGSLRWTLDAYLSMAPQAGLAGAKLYEEVLLSKGAVHTRQRRQRLERSRPELRSLFAELESVSSRLGTLAFSAPEPKKRPAWKRQIEELTELKEKLEGELSSKCAEYAREKSAGRLSPTDLQRLLPQDVALVDFLEYTHSGPRDASVGRQGSSSGARPGATAREEGAAGGRAAGREADAGAKGAPTEAQMRPLPAERHLAAFVILKDIAIVELDLGPVRPIQRAIDVWRRAIASDDSSKGEVEAATVLRQSLWEPLEKHLAGRRVVLVSPDGALGRFPLGALPGSNPGTYLTEEISIALLPVPQMLPELLEAKKPLDSPPSLLLVGDVDFEAGSPGPDLAAAQGTKADSSKEDPILLAEVRDAPRGGALLAFKPLDSTRGEILMVADTFEAAHASSRLSKLRGKNATEAAFREAAAQHEFIHLATHGFFAPKELQSALEPSKAEGLERPDQGLGPAANVTGWHPGLLSGIVLAGVNRRPDPGQDDGILTALELATLDLGRTELLVLSACETGLGATAGGEGLLGLQRAAQLAGARTVIASLWKVDDVATQALMARFYQNLCVKKMRKLEALREAQLAVLRGDLGRGVSGVVPKPDAGSEGSTDPRRLRAPPRSWAAWVLSGDWR